MNWNDAIKFYNIQKDYIDASFKNAHLLPEGIKDLGKRWLKAPIKPSFYLQGSTGSGKTYFMNVLLRNLIEKNYSNIIYKKSKWIDDELLEASMGKLLNSKGYQTTEKELIAHFSECEFLFIDDFGMEKDTDRVRQQYYTIIDERVSNQLPTIYSSNLSLKDIGKTLGDRISSRLHRSYVIEFPPIDHRKTMDLPSI